MKNMSCILLIGICGLALFAWKYTRNNVNNTNVPRDSSANSKSQLPKTEIEGAVINLLEEKCDDALYDEVSQHEVVRDDIVQTAPVNVKGDLKSQTIRILPVRRNNDVSYIVTYPWNKWKDSTKVQELKIYDSAWNKVAEVKTKLHLIYEVACDLESNSLFILSRSEREKVEDGEIEILVYSLDSRKVIAHHNIEQARIDDDIYMVSTTNGIYLFHCTFRDAKIYIKKITEAKVEVIWERAYFRFGIVYPPKINDAHNIIAFSVENDVNENYPLWLLDTATNKVQKAVQSNAPLYSNVPYKWISANRLLFLSQQNQLVDWSLYELILPD